MKQSYTSAPVAVILVKCIGSHNIQALHETTLEFSPDPIVTPRGDCIICKHARIVSTGACRGSTVVDVILIPPPWRGSTPCRTRIVCSGGCSETGYVVRRSMHCDERTMLRGCDKSALDLRNEGCIARDEYSIVYALVRCLQ